MGDPISLLPNGKATKSTTADCLDCVGIVSGHSMPGNRTLSNSKNKMAKWDGFDIDDVNSPLSTNYDEDGEVISETPTPLSELNCVFVNAVEVASLGDSHDWDKTQSHYLDGFKICNQNGEVGIGDLLVMSDTVGYLMKQDDNIIEGKTVGKSMEEVTFDGDGKASGIYGFLYCG